MMNKEEVEKRFVDDVQKHQLTIIRDDGVNRHLRMKQPGTINMYYDLITWKGYLAYTGDMGHYVFSRIDDMFEFFRTETNFVNLGYWAEKVKAVDKNAPIQEFSQTKFQASIKEYVKDYWFLEELSQGEKEEFLRRVEHELLCHHENEYEAVGAACSFQYNDQHLEDIIYDLDCREYSYRYIWCCHAIVHAINKYDEYKEESCDREPDDDRVPAAAD
jgi:hypothetical protein